MQVTWNPFTFKGILDKMWGPLLVVVLGIFVRSEFMVGANREGHPINSSQETLGTIWAQDKMSELQNVLLFCYGKNILELKT